MGAASPRGKVPQFMLRLLRLLPASSRYIPLTYRTATCKTPIDHVSRVRAGVGAASCKQVCVQPAVRSFCEDVPHSDLVSHGDPRSQPVA